MSGEADLTTSEEIAELVSAKARARALITNPGKNRVNPFFKSGYADLPAVLAAVMPAWSAEGLDLTQTVALDWPILTLTTLLAHSSGQWLRTSMRIEIADERGRSRPQSIAASVTLLRRTVTSAAGADARRIQATRQNAESLADAGQVKPLRQLLRRIRSQTAAAAEPPQPTPAPTAPKPEPPPAAPQAGNG